MKKLIVFLISSIILLFITLLPITFYLRILSGIIAIPFIYITFILSYSTYQFVTFGENYQSKTHDLIVKKVNWDGKGKILDIGTGSGSLIINLAIAFPKSFLNGIDYWGKSWEYSRDQCQQNAKIEVIKEALRVLKPGGEFIFLDLFMD